MKAGDRVFTIRVVNPGSVICEESVLVNALTTLGIPLLEYVELHIGADGEPARQRVWQWTLGVQCAPGAVPRYDVETLIRWWNDPEWIAGNPTHELAVLRVAAGNLIGLITRMREQKALRRIVLDEDAGPESGGSREMTRRVAHVPVGATAEEEERIIAFAEEL
jgi:hypothetical protein